MLNQACIVGRIVNKPCLKQDAINNRQYMDLVVCVSRNYKNDKGEYLSDYIDVRLWEGLATNSLEYLKQGNIVGIKGSISVEKSKGKKQRKMMLKADKVTSLTVAKESQSKNKENKEREER